MAENNNNEVSIGVKSNSSTAQNDLKNLTKEVEKLNSIMDQLAKYDTMIKQVTKRFSEMADVNLNQLDENLNHLPSAMEKIQKAFDGVDVNKFNDGLDRVKKATSSFANVYKKLGDMAGIDLSGLSDKTDISGLTNLSSSLAGINTGSFSTIATAVKKVTESYNLLNNMKLDANTETSIKSKLDTISETYRKFIEEMSRYDASSISSMLRAINNIPKAMEKFKAIDMDNVETQFTSLSGVIRSFIATLKEGSGELNSLATILNKVGQTKNISGLTNVGKQVDNLGNKAEKTHKKLSNMLSFGKIYAFYNQLRHFGSGFTNMLNKAIDFTEVENYFSMAMKNMRGEAMKFQTELSEMYGAAMPDMMKAQATFKNMLGALGGMSEELSYKLSEDLTKMALDYASLYNTSFEAALKKFEAALSKQVRPIRSQSGYDITQSVLGQTMQNIGINDRVIMQMSEIEKRLLIVITLQNQMYNSGAVGDYGKTIDFCANQIKVFQQQVSELGRALSSVFYGVIGSIMPYINGFIMAIRALIQTFAAFVGYEMPDSSGIIDDVLAGYGDEMDNFGGSVENTNEALNGTSDKLKEIEGQLASFDKLNVIQEPTNASSGGSSGGSGGGSLGGIDKRLLDALNNMNYKFQEADMLANQIRDRLLEWADILGEKINENIFEPVKNSWDIYGDSIFENFASGFNNLGVLISSFIEESGNNWKSFFQSASDLFFSLLDTAGLVFNAITEFMLGVWNKGGKDLFNSISRLSRGFIDLATKINDEFVKPVIKWFKNNLSDGISSAIGVCLKIISGLVDLLEDFVSFLAQKGNPTLKIFIGIWATWKITTIIKQFSDLTKGITNFGVPMSKLNGLSTVLSGNFGLLGRGASSLVNFMEKLLTKGFTPAISMFPKLNNLWTSAVGIVNKYSSNVGSAFTSLSKFTSSSPMVSGALGKIGTALSSASFGPWAIGITAASTAIIGLISYFGHLETEAEKADKRLKEFSEKRNKELEDFRESTKQNIETGLQETLMLEKNVARLKELVDENGKLIGSKDELKSIVKQINDVAPDTIKWVSDETIAIDNGIGSLDKYIEKKKAQIIVDAELEASAEALIEIRKLESSNAEKLAEKESHLAKIKKEQAIQNSYDFAIASEEERIRYVQTFGNIENYETKIRELNNEVGINTESINEYKKGMAQADSDAMALMSENAVGAILVNDNMSSLISASYENLKINASTERNAMLENERIYLETLQDENIRASKGITDEQYIYLQQQYENHKNWNNEIVKEEKLKNYGLDNLALDLARSTDENTREMLFEVWKNYKKYGYSSGEEFVSKLQEEMAKNDGVLTEASLTALGIKGEIEKQSYTANIGVSVIQNSLNAALDFVRNAFGNLSFGLSSTGDGGTLKFTPKNMSMWATGGFPDTDIFGANEFGVPEMIGRIGNKTTVASNDQITTALKQAIKEGLNESSSGSGDIYIENNNIVDGVVVGKTVEKYDKAYFMKTGKKKFNK